MSGPRTTELEACLLQAPSVDVDVPLMQEGRAVGRLHIEWRQYARQPQVPPLQASVVGSSSPRSWTARSLTELAATVVIPEGWVPDPAGVRVKQRKSPIRGAALKALVRDAVGELFGDAGPSGGVAQLRAEILAWLHTRSPGDRLDAAFTVAQRTLAKPLRRADLRNADLNGLDLGSLLEAERFDLRGAQLEGADLCGLVLRDSDLSGAKLQGVRALGARFVDCSFEGADLRGARFNPAKLLRCNLRGARLDGASFHMAVLESVDTTGASDLGTDWGDARRHEPPDNVLKFPGR